MSIIIEPLGGLGNQLFVYATGRALSIDLGVSLESDLWNFTGYKWHNYELDSFENQICNEINSLSFLNRAFIKNNYKRLFHHIFKACSSLTSPSLVKERSSIFNPKLLQASDGTRLRGYFQSAQYFSRHATSIRAEIKKILSPSKWYLTTQSGLENLGEWIGIHVRRGNYEYIPTMGITTSRYYENGLKLITQCKGMHHLVVFSDDIKAAKKLLEPIQDQNITYIDPPSNSRPLESLLIMSKASHLITANSSYSWWAAWLEDRMDRMVICPRPWLDDHKFNDRDVVPFPWVTIAR